MNYEPAELAALLSEPWSNGACRGYVIMAMRFPAICGRRILFLIRRFYREINGKGTGTNEKR